MPYYLTEFTTDAVAKNPSPYRGDSNQFCNPSTFRICGSISAAELIASDNHWTVRRIEQLDATSLSCHTDKDGCVHFTGVLNSVSFTVCYPVNKPRTAFWFGPSTPDLREAALLLADFLYQRHEPA